MCLTILRHCEVKVKFIIDITDLIFKIFIFMLIMLENAIFTEWSLSTYRTYQFLCLFNDVAIVLQIISTFMNYYNVGIFMYSWFNVVNQVLRWCPLRWCPSMRSNFNWITTRHIPSINVVYHESPMTTTFFFSTFSWPVSGWRSLKQSCSSFKMSSFWRFYHFERHCFQWYN